MTQINSIKPPKRPRIGFYSIGHAHYWNQFEGLLDRSLGYNQFIAQRTPALGDVCNVGVIDGEAIEAPILKIGNTMTHVRSAQGPTQTMNRWFALAPTHHGAMSVGHNMEQLHKVATWMGIDLKAVSLREEME